MTEPDRPRGPIVLTAVIEGCRVYLNKDGLATDIASSARVQEFTNMTTAILEARRQNADEGWSVWHIRWQAVSLEAGAAA